MRLSFSNNISYGPWKPIFECTSSVVVKSWLNIVTRLFPSSQTNNFSVISSYAKPNGRENSGKSLPRWPIDNKWLPSQLNICIRSLPQSDTAKRSWLSIQIQAGHLNCPSLFPSPPHARRNCPCSLYFNILWVPASHTNIKFWSFVHKSHGAKYWSIFWPYCPIIRINLKSLVNTFIRRSDWSIK